MPEIKGFDASHHNDVDFKAAKAAGYSFVFLKATEGQTFVDPNFETYYKEAVAAGLHVGAYHFARFHNSDEAKKEFEHFWSIVGDKEFEYPYVLDLETSQGVDKEDLTTLAIQFLEDVEAKNGFAMIYTGSYFMDSHLDEARLKNYAKWIARYASALGRTDAGIWQYTSTGSIDGVPDKTMDLDISYIDYASIIESMKKNRPPVVEKPKPAPAPKPVEVQHKGSVYSIVNYLDAHHMPSDFTNRIKLAQKLGIHHYSGTAEQNLEMVELLQKNTQTLHEDYIVRHGDTLGEIANSHHTTVAALMRLNPSIKDADEISVGQKIILK